MMVKRVINKRMLTEKKSVSLTSQKKRTVPSAKYPPNTIPVPKISLSFQLSGTGDGFTRSLEIVMMVPEYVDANYLAWTRMKETLNN